MSTTPYYMGRREGKIAKLLYVADGVETDITHQLANAGIVFIADLDWRLMNRQFVELGQAIIWDRTRSHMMTHLWGGQLAWTLMAFVQDGWVLPASVVDLWLARVSKGSGVCIVPQPSDN